MNIVKLRKVWFTLSSALVIASIAALSVWGLNLGIDFTGGSLLEVNFIEERPSKDLLLGYISGTDIETSIKVQEVGQEGFLIRMKTLSEPEHQLIINAIKDNHEIDERRFESIGPIIGQELKSKAIQSLFVVLIAIVLYIAWAFRKVSKPISSWRYGIIALIALFHDVFITVGIFSILGHFYGFEVGLPFVAALLTILGYSVNDTIVIFDRVRENLLRQSKSSDFAETVNLSIKQNLTRSINTSLTTLLVLFSIFLFGGNSISQFILALIIGIILGTYSSIFLASPLLVLAERMKFKK